VENTKRQIWAAYGCLVAGQSPVAAGLAYGYRLYARSLCDTTAPMHLQLMLVALYKCYAFTLPFTQN